MRSAAEQSGRLRGRGDRGSRDFTAELKKPLTGQFFLLCGGGWPSGSNLV